MPRTWALTSFWEKLSARERLLAAAVLGLMALGLAMILTSRAFARVSQLNATIDRLENTLIQQRQLEARGVSIDAAYVEVAAEHSSEWTESEIHNRLRQEIRRLAMEDPDAPAGVSKPLVDIPTLRQGTLNENDGYREYQLTIRITPTDIYSIVIFLVRLQQSPQCLRVDGLELRRSPSTILVDATIHVTRTIVEGVTSEAMAVRLAPPSLIAWNGSFVEEWTAEGCAVASADSIGELFADGGACLKARSTAIAATVYMTAELDAATTYELLLDVTAMGNASLGVIADADGEAYDGGLDFPADGKTYRHRVTFTVPGAPETQAKLRVPHIAFKEQGAEVYVDNVILRELME